MRQVKGLTGYVGGEKVESLPPINTPRPPSGGAANAAAIAWLDWLLRHRERSTKTIEAYESVLHAWLEWCQDRGLDPLAPNVAELEEFTLRPTRHGAPRSSATRRMEVSALRGWFGHMHARGQVAANPTADLIAPRAKRRMARPIPDEHWLVLWEGATGMLRLGMGLGYYCGLRRAEISSLHGTQVGPDLIENFVRKGGDEHTLPWREMVEHYALTPALAHLAPDWERFCAELVEHARSVRGGRMFWVRGKTFHSKMAALCQRAGVPHYTPHQLRHSCATNLVNRGQVPVQIVQELLNHASLDTTRGYIEVGGGALREWRTRTLRVK